MPAFADQLSDQQIADIIIEYKRSSWGNRGARISAVDVVTARRRATAAAGSAAGTGPAGSGSGADI
ncbi:mono/diheme cytochrome c family protein [Bradyrhizobium sp. RT9b]|uniref:c-type cytochrome n=1 Tax=Bradyrhizobium sp. RT9b TaxID=3156385 RepID=UPI003398C1B7